MTQQRERPRVLRGNRRELPPGIDPVQWANAVFDLMDAGHSEADARRMAAERLAAMERD